MGYVQEPVDYDMYANMDYWKFDEAIWLTVSYKLSQIELDSKEMYLNEYNKEYNRLSNIIIRSLDSGLIGEFIAVYDMTPDSLPVFKISCLTPFWFVEWVIKRGYKLPVELMGTKLTEFRITDIQDKIERERDDYLGLVCCEIEGSEGMSESDIMDKIKGVAGLDADENSTRNVGSGNIHQEQASGDNGTDSSPKRKNEKMQRLAGESHRPSAEAKARIRRFVEEETKPPCTCMNSQMKRYIIAQALKKDSAISLKYKTKAGEKTISENVLKGIVNKTMDGTRIQLVNMVLHRCPKHGMN